MVKLDKINKRIIFELRRNSRISDAKLAKKTNRSKDSVRYRISQLENSGIIKGYRTWVDHTKLGYLNYKMYLRLSASPKQLERLFEYIRKEPRAFALFTSSGAWSLGLAFFAKTHKEFYQIQNDLVAKFGNIIVSRTYCNMVDAVIGTLDFLYPGEPAYPVYWSSPEQNKLDRFEKKILRILSRNSRESLVNLASKCGTTVDKIRSRIKRMEDKRIIFSYTLDMDYGKMGYEFYKTFLFLKNYDSMAEKRLMSYLKGNRNIIHIVRMIGPWTLELETMVPTFKEYNQLIHDLRDKFPDLIYDVESAIIDHEELFPSKKMVYGE